jgi:hypothetical protein
VFCKNLIYIAALFTLAGCGSGKRAAGAEKYRRNYFNGYLVTNFGDTLRGRIKSQDEYDSKISFIKEDTDKIVSISSEDIRNMKINILLFEKLTINGKTKMYEKVAYGDLDLFAYHYLRGDVSENIYYLKTPDGPLRITEGNFKIVASQYLYDCPEIREKIITKAMDYDDIVDIFRLYNNCERQKGS